MQHYWLNKKDNNHLILFFGGWGTDPNPFLPFEVGDNDILMMYDYKSLELPIDLNEVLPSYKSVTLVAWSFGVWVSNHVCQSFQPHIGTGIAVNGTLDPISDDRGIPVEIFEGTMSNLSPLNIIKFNRRVLRYPEERKQFEANAPKRSWEDLRDELSFLKTVLGPEENHLFQHAVIGDGDLIFMSSNQRNYWDDGVNVIPIEGSHFPFYRFKSWNDIIEKLTIKHA